MLRRRSIRLRIIVLVLVPVVALIGLYAVVLNLTLGNLLSLYHAAAIRNQVALPVASVQNQLGTERTMALQYLAMPDKASLKALIGQENKTDFAIRQYRGAVQAALKSGPVKAERDAFVEWQADLGRINTIRTTVTARGYTKSQAVRAYSFDLDEGDNVLNQAIIPVQIGTVGVQADNILTMAQAAQNVGEESDLLRADLIDHWFPPSDLRLVDQLMVLHQNQSAQTLPNLDPSLRVYFRTLVPQTAVQQITAWEADVSRGPAGARQVPLAGWTSAESKFQKGYLKALLGCAATLAKNATTQAEGLVVNLVLIAGLGLLAIIISIVVAFVLGRGLIRQLNDLRQSALTMASQQLPGTLERLRAGEEVDVSAEVPQLEPGADEIGQVRQAFNTAAQTAIAAAVDEVKIRRGVNDVFRNLARRNQSLLTRQLQLLDAMERRVHDPEELADLFRIDHLTTRMRRHAEGLLIVAGGSSGRIWREPVPIIDVMRAAVAEVEDYTRIRVGSRTDAAVAGHAVADIIHLLAELVENATTFSPASTPVRVDGDKVARGLVIEIEDRGLGMSETHIARLNSLLLDPPLFDLSGSDQLGLFIAGQLARRHDVRVTLRSSPYGGITAVVLIPRALVVDADYADELTAFPGLRELGGRPVPQLTAAPSGDGGSGDGRLDLVTAGYLPANDTNLASSVAGQVTEVPSAPMPGAGHGTRSAPHDDSWSGLPTRQPSAVGRTFAEIESRAISVTAEPADPADLGTADSANLTDLDGLPTRVRQASLVPQLRDQYAASQPDAYDVGPEPSPEEARNTMAALQYGWERGRLAEPDPHQQPPSPTPRQAQPEGEHQ